MSNGTESGWKFHGVRVVKDSELDSNTAQTPGMNRAAAITHARDHIHQAEATLP